MKRGVNKKLLENLKKRYKTFDNPVLTEQEVIDYAYSVLYIALKDKRRGKDVFDELYKQWKVVEKWYINEKIMKKMIYNHIVLFLKRKLWWQ